LAHGIVSGHLPADFVDAQGKKLKSAADSVSMGTLVRLEQKFLFV